MGVSLETLLKGLPTGPEVPADIVAALAASSDRVLVVLDDDPTGTQSVADLPVLMSWTPSSMEWALRQGKPAVYVMTNSRSLAPNDAAERNRQVPGAPSQPPPRSVSTSASSPGPTPRCVDTSRWRPTSSRRRSSPTPAPRSTESLSCPPLVTRGGSP